MADSPEEKAHWRSVLRSFDGYMQYHLSANHARRMAFLSLPKEEREMYELVGFREKLEAVDEGIRRNSEFIDRMIEDPVFVDMLHEDPEPHGHAHQDHHNDNGHSHGLSHDHSHGNGHSHSHSHTHPPTPAPTEAPRRTGALATLNVHGDPRPSQAENDQAQEKVRSTLRSLVRDWAVEGAEERDNCYRPCLEALERHYPSTGSSSSSSARAVKDRNDVKVLVPGCGLGRLAMEIASRGFFSQGNEFSTYMLVASHYMLNQSTHRHCHSIYPYLHSYSNHSSTMHSLLRRIQIPDIVPAEVLGDGKGGEFSLVAGDFEEIYGEGSWDIAHGVEGEEGQRGKWGAVVTCFFIDCARNVLTYLRIIHTLLADDGVWINLGPLLWHFENSPTKSAKGEGSIELSLDEVKQLARHVGFEIHDEQDIETTYTGIPDGLLKHQYKAAFWTATKRKD